MTVETTVTLTAAHVTIELSVGQLAMAFSELSDDDQAQFIIEVARIAESWPAGGNVHQWIAVGVHLRQCECSTPEARRLVKDIALGVGSGPGDL